MSAAVTAPPAVEPSAAATLVAVRFDADWMVVTLDWTGRRATFRLPVEWFPALAAAPPADWHRVRIADGGGRVVCPEFGVDVPASAFKALVDYSASVRYRVPPRNVRLDTLADAPPGQPTFIELSSGPDGLGLRRARSEDAPVVPHPITGTPYRWLSYLQDMRPDLAEGATLVCEVGRRLVPLGAQLASESVAVVGQTTHHVPIDTPAAARAAADMLHLIADEASRADAVTLIRNQLTPAPKPGETLLDLLAELDTLPDNPDAPPDGSVNYRRHLYGSSAPS